LIISLLSFVAEARSSCFNFCRGLWILQGVRRHLFVYRLPLHPPDVRLAAVFEHSGNPPRRVSLKAWGGVLHIDQLNICLHLAKCSFLLHSRYVNHNVFDAPTREGRIGKSPWFFLALKLFSLVVETFVPSRLLMYGLHRKIYCAALLSSLTRWWLRRKLHLYLSYDRILDAGTCGVGQTAASRGDR